MKEEESKEREGKDEKKGKRSVRKGRKTEMQQQRSWQRVDEIEARGGYIKGRGESKESVGRDAIRGRG